MSMKCVVCTNTNPENKNSPGILKFLNKKMTKILNKIWDYIVLDSEIIQETESAKHNDIGFDINWRDDRRDNFDWTLLMWAVFYNREELIRYFLTYPDININNKDCDGWTALYISCYTNNVLIIKLLLGHKDIDVNIQNRFGQTGLHNACFNNNIEIVRELLLDARVDIWIRDKDGLSARDIAMQNRCRGIANMLKRIGRMSLLRILNKALCRDISRMIIEEYVGV